MINARMETLTQRPAFRSLLAANRCMIPASGYYEWKADGKIKTPYYIHPRSGSFVAFAGLYDTWTNPQGEEIQTCTIVTRDADDAMPTCTIACPWCSPERTSRPGLIRN
jgi:putative SOS response-associated peptidase YedK